MASVYILFSKKINKFYIGSCKDIVFRIEQHLNKTFSDSFTSNTNDWELYLLIDDLTYVQARQIEIHIKKMKSKVYVENLTKHPDVIEKLKQKYPNIT